MSSPTVDVQGLGKHLGGRWIFRDVEMALEAGQAYAVRGVNGAGKSTLLRVMAGVLDADLGDVTILGHSLRRERVPALQAVGYVAEAGDLPEALTVRELGELVAALRGVDMGSAALHESLDLSAQMDQRFGTLSLGQRRRAGLYLASLGTPSVLLLDEPSNGLDAASLGLLHAWLDAQIAAGRAVLLATHDAALIARCAARSWTLAEGRLTPET